LYRPSDEIKQTLNFQFSTSTDVNRYDRLTDRSGEDLKFAEWYYGPQTRWLGAYRMDHTALFHLDRVSLQLAYQNVQESRHNRKYKSDYLGSRFEKVNIFSATLDAEKNIAKHQLRFGIDMNLNWLNSSAYKTVKNSGQREPLDTRYPDGDNTMHSVDAFLMHRCPVTSNGLHWFNGLRVGGSFLHSSIVDKSFFPFPFDWIRQNNFTYSLSSSLVKMFKEDHSLALNVSTGFRVPNVDDVGKVFDSQPGSVIVPNQNLRPEQTLSADLSYKQKISDQLRFDASVYYTWLWDAIIVEPTLFAGKDSMMYDGVQSQVLHNANARKGQIYGVSLSLQHNMDRLSTDASVSYTRGMAYTKEEKTPLDHISPLFGKISVKYRYLRRKPLSRFEFFTLFNGRKDIKYYNLEGEDNIRYATVKGVAGKGLPAWFTLNARVSYEALKDLYVDCSVLNLLDTEYRTFASGINAPGRAFQFTVRYKL
ncbi:MAG: TonB-dependent receptor domain-containing protein, partial [Bacteroidales bacterium]